jgi:DNA modification methylase
MQDKSVDLILTDPPYDFSTREIEYLQEQFLRLSKNGIIIFSPPENQWTPPEQYGFWIKPISTKNTSRRYSRFVEMIFFYNTTVWNTERKWCQYTNVFTDLVEGGTGHPFEKPISLIRRLILNHSNPGDIILDPFMGSGTVPLVAKDLSRQYIGVELSPEYFKIAEERVGL